MTDTKNKKRGRPKTPKDEAARKEVEEAFKKMKEEDRKHQRDFEVYTDKD